MVEIELGASIYSRSEAVAMNVISPVRITARQWLDERFRGLGSSGLVHWLGFSVNLGRTWAIL